MTKRVYGSELLDFWFQRRMADVHTALPAKVLAYDAAAQTIDVRPQISRYIFDEDTDERTAEALPDLFGIPVAFPRGGGFHVTFPLAAGDYVLVICSEEPTIAWRDKAREITPGLFDRHGLNGAFALPCGYPDKEKLPNTPSTTDLEISSDDETGSVTVKAGEVLLGDNTASQYVALANLVDSIFTQIDTVFRSGWTPVAMDGGAALKAAWVASFTTPPSTVAAAKTKAK